MNDEAVMSCEDGRNTLVFTRVFKAPVPRVFRAWTDPRMLEQWWGPRAFQLSVLEMDVSVGGIWRYVLTGPDGVEYPSEAVFEIVDPPRQLIFLNVGGHVSDKHLTCRMIVDFLDQGDTTRVTLQMEFQSKVELDRAVARGAMIGGQQTFDRLETVLNSEAGGL